MMISRLRLYQQLAFNRKELVVEPPPEHVDMGVAPGLPRFMITHKDVLRCLRAYHGPTVELYPYRVIQQYLYLKAKRGLSLPDLVSKLEALESEMPIYINTFAMVRETRGLGPSKVLDMEWPPVYDVEWPSLQVVPVAEHAM
ncbi:uncharacterized protein LOC62_05G007538 [Vanrija pseudolonga]|uniref:Uncharacterized protein n=1 Tax=Vanrija pseudolonga TaxID=143232 RepID=A0AAF0YG52_9TREE|nr:hypothetical protein LOC62_05G007538 [Vanrija pseudolonga]